MSRHFNGSSDKLARASTSITAYPFTIAAWANADTTPGAGTDYYIAAISDTDGNGNQSLIYTDANEAGIINYDGVAFGAAASSTSTSTGTWDHFAAVFTSSTSRDAFLNGGGKVNDTTSVSFLGGIDNTTIGVTEWLTVDFGHFDGAIAEVGIWDVALTDAEIACLGASGFSPLFIRPASLVTYVPLIGRASPEQDFVGTGFTVTGTTTDPHPRIIMPVPAFVSTPAVAAAGLSISVAMQQYRQRHQSVV